MIDPSYTEKKPKKKVLDAFYMKNIKKFLS